MRSLRVAAHVHSEWSYDGEWSLANIARTFRRLRYDAVLMAEHDRTFDQRRWNKYQLACAEASSAAILLVPGIEYEDADNVVHTPVWGATSFFGSGRPTLEVLRAADEERAAALFAHPWRRDAISRFKPEWASLLSAVEIWNRRYDGVAPRREAKLLADGEALASFVSLDFHTARQFFPLAMAASLDEAPSPAALVDSIRNRRCRPELLGFSALRFTSGPESAALRALEHVRLGARRMMRGSARPEPPRSSSPLCAGAPSARRFR